MWIKNSIFSWWLIPSFVLVCLGAGLFYRGRSGCFPHTQSPRPMWDLISCLQQRHPDWKARNETHTDLPLSFHRCYLLAPPARDGDYADWSAPSLLSRLPTASCPVAQRLDEINQYSFDAAAWRRIVFVCHFQDYRSKQQGWYGHVLLKGPFLFYGDKEMLREIDKDLE